MIEHSIASYAIALEEGLDFIEPGMSFSSIHWMALHMMIVMGGVDVGPKISQISISYHIISYHLYLSYHDHIISIALASSYIMSS